MLFACDTVNLQLPASYTLRNTQYVIRHVYAEVEGKVGGQALDHESLLGSPVTRYTPATSQPGSLPGVLPVQRQ